MTTTPTPRPVPTREDRMRDATARAEIDQAIESALDAHTAAYHPGQPCPENGTDRCAALPPTGRSFRTYLTSTERDQLDAEVGRMQDELDEMREARDILRAQLDQTRAQLGAATDALATIRDAGERIDRALAAYDTRHECRGDLGSAGPRAQEQPEVPAWVLDLVRWFIRYEAEHPKLYRYTGQPGRYEPWNCPASLLAPVPAEVRRQAEKAEG